jgi:hypothetical protein
VKFLLIVFYLNGHADLLGPYDTLEACRAAKAKLEVSQVKESSCQHVEPDESAQ